MVTDDPRKSTKHITGEDLQAVDEKVAARKMNRAIQTLRNDRHLRQGCPYLKVGRSVRYLLSDIEEYLLKHRIDPEGA